MFVTLSGFAQNPGDLDTTFNLLNPEFPSLENGTNASVFATVVQPDGKIIIGGDFTAYNGVEVNRIARINTDGSLDTSFNVGVGLNDEVLAITLLDDGKIMIGGMFTSYNGTTLKYIGRLNTDGSLDTSFFTGEGPNQRVKCIVKQPDGKLIISGSFNFYNGNLVNGFIRTDSNGTVDPTFVTGSGYTISKINLQPDGKIIIVGSFESFSGVLLNGIARLNTDGSLDMTFSPGTGFEVTSIFALAIQPDGKILVGGYFEFYNDTPINRIIRLNPDGTLDSSFVIGSGVEGGGLRSIILQPDGKIIIGGNFSSFNGIDKNNIARLNMDGSLDNTFDSGTGVNFMIHTVFLLPNEKIIISGNFNVYDGTNRGNFAILNNDGSLDATFSPETGANNDIHIAKILPDGKIIIGGKFTTYDGVKINRIARLHPDGSLDTSFNPGTGTDNFVGAIAIQPDGKIIIGGQFTTFNDVTCNNIARLNSDGSLDTTFNIGTGTNTRVYTIVLQPDGKIIIGGTFFTYNQTFRSKIARLNSDGSLDTSFDPQVGANSTVSCVALDNNNKIYIAGGFTSYNETTRNGIARLHSDGSLDTTFSPTGGATGGGPIYAIKVLPSEKIIIAGNFAYFNGTLRNCLARINTDGSLDMTFNPNTVPQVGTGLSGPIYNFVFQPNGKMIIVGAFTTFNGASRINIARVNANGSLDYSFNPGTSTTSGLNNILTTDIQPDGRIIIGGYFTHYTGIRRDCIARIHTSNVLSINDVKESEFHFYPNPTKGDFYLNSDDAIEFVEIYNMVGKKIKSISINSNEAVLKLQDLPIGAYVARVFANNSYKSIRIIKE